MRHLSLAAWVKIISTKGIYNLNLPEGCRKGPSPVLVGGLTSPAGAPGTRPQGPFILAPLRSRRA